MSGDAGQVRLALAAQAASEVGGGVNDAPTELLAYQAYLQRLAPWDVVVPFATELAEAIGRGANAPRIQRDFQRLLSLVKAVTVLRHQHRATGSDGRLVATPEDYATVYSLVEDMYRASVTGASEGVTEVVTKIGELQGGDAKVTYAVLSKATGVHRDLIWRRVATAIRNGWAVNRETRRNHQADLVLGDPLPEMPGLPRPEQVCHPVTPVTDGYAHTHARGTKTGATDTLVL